MAKLQREDFDVGAQIRAIVERNTKTGAAVSFLGVARDFSKGEAVEKLVFESYVGMAEKELNRLESDAIKKFDILNCLVIHRTGEIRANENIVLIVVTSMHRAVAFEACEWMIDQLKRRTPIWKHEYAASGKRWVEDHP